jgi:hypothetical protein
VNVYIARRGTVLGEYPREHAEEMARTGALLPEDHYWAEGMIDWLPLPDLLMPDASAAKIVRLNRFGHSQNGTFHGRAVNGTNVFIARDGAVIGEYPRDRLEEMARAHELEREDSYWRDGMEDWLPLSDLLAPEDWEPPPPPPPPPNYVALIGTGAVALLILGSVGFFLMKPDRSGQVSKPMSAPLPIEDAATGIQIRDKAAADLRQRIDRLPEHADPPFNTFYYDFQVSMSKVLSSRASWRATIHGWESIMDSQGKDTILRTDLTLTTDYEDGEWVFKYYRASVSDLAEGTTREIEEDQNSAVPPSIVGVLGLKRGKVAMPVSLKMREK